MASGTKITTTGVLYINGQQVENTFTNISKITKKLESELRKLPVGTKEFIDKAEELKRARARFEEVKNEIDKVSGKLKETNGFMGFFRNGLIKIGDTMREVFTANLFERALDAIIDKGKQTVDQLLEIADAMTDVQKTSGMSSEQVKELWTQFDEMDTRTTKMERLKIAEVGGRLGVPIEEMKSFVQEVDKAYVALGDSFEGGLEGVVDQLGKIKGLFNTTKEMSYAEAIDRIGSALNTLAAQGTASEGNISQFTLRVGALPDSLKPAIDKVLGLGAAFEESGVDAQIASSGLSNFLTTAAENIEGFAYSMHMSVAQAKELINTKPEEFFLRFAEGMKGVPADQTAKIFASLKLNSLEVQKAVGAAANKTDEFRKAMKTAGAEMDKMTSLQNEFNTKNNNAPAILEKIKNAWNDIFTSTNVINKFEWLIQLIGWMTGVTSTASNGVLEFKERLVFLWNILKVTIAALISYNTVVLISTIATGNLAKATWLSVVADKAQAIAIFAKRVALLAYEVVLGLVTGNILRARAAMIAFNTTTKMNPLGLLIALVVAAVVAYQSFSKELDAATKKQKLLNDVQKEAEKGILSQKNELQNLLRIAKDETLSKEARYAAIKKINQISPEYLGNLRLENINTQKATDAVKAYTEELLKNSKIKVLNSKLDKAQGDLMDINDKPLSDYGNVLQKNLPWEVAKIDKLDKNMRAQFEKWAKEKGKAYAISMMGEYGNIYESLNQTAKEKQNEINDLTNEITNLTKENPGLITNNNGPTNIAAPEKPKKNREANQAANDLEKSREEYNKALEAKAEANKKQLELDRAYEYEKFAILFENKQKELDLETSTYNRKKEDISQQNTEIENQIKKSENDILKLERDKKDTKSPAAKVNFQNAINELEQTNKARRSLISKNNQIEEQLCQTHEFNILRIEEKYDIIKYQKQEEALQAKADLERKSAEDMINNISTIEEAKQALSEMKYLKLTDKELAGIKTLEDAKKALRENADRAYLESQVKLFEDQQKLLDDLLKDPSLSPESVEKLKKDLEELRLKLTQVTAAKKGKTEEDQAKVIAEGRDTMSQVDILGFSATQWADTFANLDTTQQKLAAVKMGVQALSNAFSMFSQLQSNLNQKELNSFSKNQDKKKKALLKQLNEGYINQEEYHKGLQLLDEQTDTKKREIAVKQAKMQKIQAVAQIAINTASAIMSIWAQVPKFDFGISAGVLTGIVAALGAVQAGIVLSQPLPESYADGGFTGSGFGSKDSSGFKPAGIVHENEYVVPKWMLEQPRIANVVNYLESVRQGKTKPMAEGGFTPDNTTSDVAAKQGATESNDTLIQYVAVMSDVKSLLQKLYDEGVIAKWTDDPETGKRMKSAIKKFDTIETRASGK